jgi:hypothetical protein
MASCPRHWVTSDPEQLTRGLGAVAAFERYARNAKLPPSPPLVVGDPSSALVEVLDTGLAHVSRNPLSGNPLEISQKPEG